MQHLLIVYWIISFGIGFTTLLGVVLLYLKDRLPVLRNYLFIMVCLSVLVITSGIKVYSRINLIHLDANLDFSLDIVSLVVESPLILLCPLFLFSFFDSALFKRRVFLLLIPLSCFNFIFSISTYLFFPFLFFHANIILLGSIIFSSVFCILALFIHWKKITNKTLRLYFIALCIMGGICLLLFSLDLFLFFDQKIREVSGSFRVGVAIYLLWNLITLIFAMRLLANSRDEPVKRLAKFIGKYGLTLQEKRVVEFIIEGNSNSKIGEKLFISPGTVKRHVYNIFKKTKAASRLDLLQRIRET